MEVVRGLENIGFEPDSAVTVGSFDGVHLGHRRILRRMKLNSRRSTTVLTFDPHPQVVTRSRGEPPPQITTFEERIELFKQIGLDRLIIARFDTDFAKISAADFISQILIKQVGMSKIFVGPRHGFGAGRRGDIHTLSELSGRLGFDVEVVPPVIRKGDFVSSNRIRKCLAGGDVLDAWRFLGKPFYLRGRVIEGDKRGKRIGFPTANLSREKNSKLTLRSGVYATITEVGGRRFQSVSHIGARPTIKGAAPTVESHIIGFDANIYGEFISIGFIEFLRETEAFDSIEELTAQIKRDRDLAIQRLLERGFGRYSAFSDRRTLGVRF